MFSRIVPAILGLSFALSFILLFTVGCESDSDSNPSPTPFSVQFTDFPPSNASAWVVLHNLSGDSVLMIQPTTATGKVNFGVVNTEHVTFTTIAIYGSRSFVELNSYVDVPSGEWRIPWPSSFEPQYYLGSARITMNYPVGDSTIILDGPDAGHYVAIDPSDSTFSWTIPVYSLDANHTISLFAHTNTHTSYHCGWLLNQPFEPLPTNAYTINLAQTAPTKTIEINSPRRVTAAYLNAFHGECEFPFALDLQEIPDAGPSTITVHEPAFPVSKYYLRLVSPIGTEFFEYDCLVDHLPSSLNISVSTLSAEYNASAHRFDHVSVIGDADDMVIDWSDQHSLGWLVHTNPHYPFRTLPMVPDTLLARWSMSRSDFSGYAIYTYDCDNVSSFSGYMVQEYQTNSEWWQRWNSRVNSYRIIDTLRVDKSPEMLRWANGMNLNRRLGAE
jgi:hypothetical protein